jgi:hypothetical protein
MPSSSLDHSSIGISSLAYTTLLILPYFEASCIPLISFKIFDVQRSMCSLISIAESCHVPLRPTCHVHLESEEVR